MKKMTKEEVKCEVCPFLKKGKQDTLRWWWCEKLNHEIEHGYAMVFHSQFCGE